MAAPLLIASVFARMYVSVGVWACRRTARVNGKIDLEPKVRLQWRERGERAGAGANEWGSGLVESRGIGGRLFDLLCITTA